MDALEAIDRPCDPLLNRESTIDSNLKPSVNPPQAQAPARSYIARHRVPGKVNQPANKLLFVRNNSSTPPLIARLQCTDCGRWDFAAVQGFLNHCRIRHQREYGGHDDCIQHCSVIVPEEEHEWVVQNGTEITGVGIPSLRRLFEIAVGGKSSSIFPVAQNTLTAAEDNQHAEGDAMIVESTVLSRTLGHHKDTPALAPFLGRKAARRRVNVENPEDSVDVDSGEAKPSGCWHMPFSHRNRARPELDVGLDPPETSDNLEDELPRKDYIQDAAQLSLTRFHISARVLVADRSRWLPPGETAD
jgi:hypothetical protein